MTGSHWHNESCAGIITPGHINSLWTGASVVTISAQQLRSLIVTFPNRQPLTAVAIQERLDGGWSDEQAHLDGWLAEYDGPGYYNRAGHNYDAKYFYNHFQDGYGLMWLAEAVGVDRSVLEQGASATYEKRHMRPGSVAAAFRKVCPWTVVEACIMAHLEAR